MSTTATKEHLATKLVASRGLGEAVTDVGARLTTFAIRQLFAGPHAAVAQFLKQYLVLPHLTKFEATIDSIMPAVETVAERTARLQKTPDARALHIAESMLNLSTDFVGGYVLQVVGQQALDDVFKIPRVGYAQQAKFAALDRAAQVGSFLLLNPIAGPTNKAAQKPISGFIGRVMKMIGMPISEEKADWYASQMMNVRLPNLLGSISAGAAQYHHTQRNL